MAWLIANFSDVLGVAASALGLVILMLHLAHRDSMAAALESIKADLEKLNKKS